MVRNLTMITQNDSQQITCVNENDYQHVPVLLKEVIEGLNINPDGIYVDLTLGRAGHSQAILAKLNKGLLVGIDRDLEAIRAAKEILAKQKRLYIIRNANFKDVDLILDELNIRKIDGALLDLGVSSPQFDDPNRGFSYRYEARLDMRMDQKQSFSAYDIINSYSEEKLTYIFKEYGDEKFARSIAKNIVNARKIKPIETTFDLVEIIKSSKPSRELRKIGHPAKQVFQALRIEVNDEFNALKEVLDKITERLNIHGRLAIITFHSGEDRIVKTYFKKLAVIEGDRSAPPINPKNLEQPKFRLVNRKAIEPSEEEKERNHRATSAKLRIIERIG